jgi:hypothetical protein
MKNIKKLILVLLLVAVLIASLVACANGSLVERGEKAVRIMVYNNGEVVFSRWHITEKLYLADIFNDLMSIDFITAETVYLNGDKTVTVNEIVFNNERFFNQNGEKIDVFTSITMGNVSDMGVLVKIDGVNYYFMTLVSAGAIPLRSGETYVFAVNVPCEID